MNLQPKYHRVLLKLSGEALANGQKDSILDFTFIDQVCPAVVVSKLPSLNLLVKMLLTIGFFNVYSARMI